ncbi:hypothetical protein C8R26_11712 [Nitrosomonas oligotropha]|uniref:Uncharacterized protein n=1 Tax=Nitrosomonas oligotropha TaxID=42354 RepID=A0A2T5HXW4_9PROT|nr:hypothetical protein [Nitrosomonas oligotropha]PTQ76419.1 hypothetical protein C8R26_11712 [Nitrosomonas oligotropha]
MGDGKAIIIWKIKEKRYDAYISYRITRSMQGEPQLLALSLKGILNANSETGWPKQQNFSMDSFKIIARLAYKKEIGAPTQSYKFTDCTYNANSTEERIETFTCSLITRYSEQPESIRSESKVTFTRLTSLH